MYPECVAFLRETMRVREMHYYYYLSHSHGFAQKRNAWDGSLLQGTTVLGNWDPKS